MCSHNILLPSSPKDLGPEAGGSALIPLASFAAREKFWFQRHGPEDATAHRRLRESGASSWSIENLNRIGRKHFVHR